VIAIVGILIALLLPSVQAARESARRTSCTNNHKQIAVAFQMHHDSHGVFPWGGNDGPYSCCDATIPSYYCWTFHILPYLEQQSVYDLPKVELKRTPVPTYHCPSRREVKIYQSEAKCDYAANGGTEKHVGIVTPTDVTPRIAIKQITDGTTNTLLVGETRAHVAYLEHGQSGYYSDNEDCYTNGWADEVVKRSLPVDGSFTVPAPDLTNPDNLGSVVHGQFGSSHPNGMQASLCDSSVRTISYDVDPLLFRRFCRSEDGEIVDLDQL
jgi:type II secretory pathway pseudopilin PulG